MTQHTTPPARTLPGRHIAARARSRRIIHAYDLGLDAALCGVVFPGCLDAFGDELDRVTCAGCRERMPEATPPPAAGPKVAKLRRLAGSGAIQALSSDGHTVYDVSIGERLACTCAGFVHHGHCYHSTQAAQRYAAMWALPAGIRLPVNVTRIAVAQTRKARVSDLYGPDEVA